MIGTSRVMGPHPERDAAFVWFPVSGAGDAGDKRRCRVSLFLLLMAGTSDAEDRVRCRESLFLPSVAGVSDV